MGNLVFTLISKIPEHKSAWALLWLSAFAFEVTALYFQYAMGLAPCVKCIYQRTAMLGILFAGLIPFISNNAITRFVGFGLWGLSAVWGLIVAIDHVDIQMNPDPFFSSCEIVPNFPVPLYDWIPFFFNAPGDCGTIDWQFLNFTMPQWMVILFGLYCFVLFPVLLSRLAVQKSF